MAFMARKRNWVPHPDGSFVAEVGKIKEVDTKFGKRLTWELVTGVIDENGNELSISHFTGFDLTPKSKLLELVEVCTQKTMDELPDEFDLESIIGTQIQIYVTHHQKEDGSVLAKIQSLFPIPPQPGNVANVADENKPPSVDEPPVIDDIPF